MNGNAATSAAWRAAETCAASRCPVIVTWSVAPPPDPGGQLVPEGARLVSGQRERGEAAEHEQVQPLVPGGSRATASIRYRSPFTGWTNPKNATTSASTGTPSRARLRRAHRLRRSRERSVPADSGRVGGRPARHRGRVPGVGGDEHRGRGREPPRLAVEPRAPLDRRPRGRGHPPRGRPPAVLVQRRDDLDTDGIRQQADPRGEPEGRGRELDVHHRGPQRADPAALPRGPERAGSTATGVTSVPAARSAATRWSV